MGPNDVKKLLETLGISSSIIVGLTIVGFGAWIYKNYLEIQSLHLEAENLQLQINRMKNGQSAFPTEQQTSQAA